MFNITFNYDLDTEGFFSGAEGATRRATLYFVSKVIKDQVPIYLRQKKKGIVSKQIRAYLMLLGKKELPSTFMV